jgi:iron complex outermembrane receptor protein
LKDQFNKNDLDFSGRYDFDPVISPRAGLIFQLTDKNMVFLSVSHGFSTPKLEETLLPDGLINNDIEPETGWNYELGSRGQLWRGLFNYEISAYIMDIENLLVARRTGDDQFIGINAGRTIHRGIEAGLNYFLVDHRSIQLRHSNSLSLNDYFFEDFEDLNSDHSGNDLTGVPDKTFFSQLELNTSAGIYAFVNYQFTGKIPVNDSNSVYADSYQLVNFKTGYRKGFGKKWELNLYLGINNLFDEKYASMLQINAGSFGNAAPRYYYPGEPLNFYSGMYVKYIF